jgi:hypothetical protein
MVIRLFAGIRVRFGISRLSVRLCGADHRTLFRFARSHVLDHCDEFLDQ